MHTIQQGSAYTTYTWDYDNRLVLAQTPSNGVLTNSYDAQGLRQTYQTAATGAVTLTYDAMSMNLLRQDAAKGQISGGQETDRFLYTPETFGSPIAQLSVAAGSSVTQSYAFSDQTHNIAVTANGQGGLVTGPSAYMSFGLPTPGSSGPTYPTPLAYGGDGGGYYNDQATGLHVALHRWGDKVTGRWISKDPIGFDGGDWSNLFRIVGNNPVNTIDANGLKPHSVAFIVDDAPHVGAQGTQFILSQFKQGYGTTKNIRAYFAVIGRNVDAHYDLMRSILGAGHVVVNHTQHHWQPFSALTDNQMYDEFCQVHNTLLYAFGYRMHWYRAPGESRSDSGKQLAWDRIDKAAKRVDSGYTRLMENSQYPHTIYTLNDEASNGSSEDAAIVQAQHWLKSSKTVGNVFLAFHDPVVSQNFMKRLFALVLSLDIKIRNAN